MIFALLLFAPALAVAQDMPLHEILKPGETWQKTDAKMPAAARVGFEPKPAMKGLSVPTGARAEPFIELPLERPTCVAAWHNGATLLVGDAGGKHVWAFRVGPDGALSGGEKYLPLRLRKGDEQSEASALCVDGSERVYAAYKEGIMAFDPTGRPCGLITSPGAGPVKALAFEGNVLYAQVGDQVYARKMLAKK